MKAQLEAIRDLAREGGGITAPLVQGPGLMNNLDSLFSAIESMLDDILEEA